MLFRNKDGKLVLICKSEYKNDILYYKSIMNTINYMENNPSVCANASENASANASFDKQMDNMVNTISNLLYKKHN